MIEFVRFYRKVLTYKLRKKTKNKIYKFSTLLETHVSQAYLLQKSWLMNKLLIRVFHVNDNSSTQVERVLMFFNTLNFLIYKSKI